MAASALTSNVNGFTRPFTRHGGRLADARAAFPHAPAPWIDLSTGINPRSWPVRNVKRPALDRLPDPADTAALERVAGETFGADPTCVVAVPGADAGLRLLPYLTGARDVAIMEPTYSGHRAAWEAAGISVRGIDRSDRARCSAGALVVVNPNNPDGGSVSPQELLALARNRWLIVDESFVEAEDQLSIAAQVADRIVVLRSFGKFYGLAGVRLGFVIAAREVADRLRAMIGDWPVSVMRLRLAAQLMRIRRGALRRCCACAGMRSGSIACWKGRVSPCAAVRRSFVSRRYRMRRPDSANSRRAASWCAPSRRSRHGCGSGFPDRGSGRGLRRR